jgi:hypothetical protein
MSSAPAGARLIDAPAILAYRLSCDAVFPDERGDSARAGFCQPPGEPRCPRGFQGSEKRSRRERAEISAGDRQSV